MSAASDPPQEEAASSAIVRPRAAPPPPPPRRNIPPPPFEELPPPYDSVAFPSLHAQSSRLLAGWQPSQKPPEERFVSATNNRNPRAANRGLRTCTRHLTARNLLVTFVVFLVLIGSIALFFHFLIVSGNGDNRWIEDTRLAIRNGDHLEGGRIGQIAETAFSVRFVPPSTTAVASTTSSYVPTTISSTAASTTSSHSPKRATNPLKFKLRILGAFKEKEQQMIFDKKNDEIILSKYYPDERLLKSERLNVSNYRAGFTSKAHRTPAGYAKCSRFSDDWACCATSTQAAEPKTDCFAAYESIGNLQDADNTSAPLYDYADVLHLKDYLNRVIIFNGQQYALFAEYTGNILPIEDNRLTPSYVSAGFDLPLNDIWKLEELVRSKDDFKICKYEWLFYSDNPYKFLPPCQSTPFKVDNELPKVKFCSDANITAVVQYGHRGREDDLIFLVELVFNGENKVYTSQEHLRTPYEQLAMDCNAVKKTLDIYVMGETQIVAFSLEISDIRPS